MPTVEEKIVKSVIAVAVNDTMLQRDVPIDNVNVAAAQPKVTNAVMAAINASPNVSVVPVTSPFLSKVNWAQVITVALTLLTVVGADIPAETKIQVVEGIGAIGSVVTIVIKTFFTKSISSSSK